MIKFKATVTEIGPHISEFIKADMLVLFGESAPEELREFSIVHNGNKFLENIVPGDQITIDESIFKILAVGNVANINLANLGHLIIKFNGLTEAKLPGDVCVEKKEIPPINIGTVFIIFGED